jgi:hypothetical protein
MRCLSEQDLLSLFNQEGDVTQQSHLASCQACAAKYRQLENDLKVISQTLQAIPPPAMVHQRLAGFNFRWLPAAVALTLIVAMVWSGARLRSPANKISTRAADSGEAWSILDDLPSNPFLLNEAIAKELGMEDSDVVEVEAIMETEWPADWQGSSDASEAAFLVPDPAVGEDIPCAECLEPERRPNERTPFPQLSKKFYVHRMEVP